MQDTALSAADEPPPDRLGVALADYYERMENGRVLDLEAFLAEYPDLINELRPLLTAAAAVAQWAGASTPLETPRNPPSGSATSGDLPETFGRYRILDKLGRGGMGTVYLAHDSQLDRRVALKVPHFARRATPDVLERFRREAKAAATIVHPNICPVYDVGQENGIAYLTMALIEGERLSDVLHKGRLSGPLEVAKLVAKLARAMQEAHDRQVIHRDLKPSNIMINHRQEPVIMDFGLAQRLDRPDDRVTESGLAIGTPAYMAPEQRRGAAEAIGPGSDIYSLGVILKEMLSPPPQRPLPPTPTTELLPDSSGQTEDGAKMDAELAAICRKAMAPTIAGRYASMSAMAAALESYLQRGVEPAPVRSRSWRRLAALAGAGVIMGGFLLYAMLRDATIEIELEPAEGRVEIRLDDEVIDIARLGQLTLTPGVHRLNVTGPEIEPMTQSFRVQRGPNPALRVALVRKDPVAKQPDPVPAPQSLPKFAGKPMPPSRESIAAAKIQLQERYRFQLVGKPAADRVKLAKKLSDESSNVSVDRSDVRYALLEMAGDVAATAGDFRLALETCGQIFNSFDIDPLTLRISLLKRVAPRLEGSEAQLQESLCEAMLGVGFEAIAHDRYEEGRELAGLAKTLADRTGAPYLVYQAGFLTDEVTRNAAWFERVKAFLVTRRARPEDPEANAEAGKFFCLAKNDWDNGLLMLTKASDAELRDLAAYELRRPVLMANCIELGDQWWEAGAKGRSVEQFDFWRRARHWYLKGLALMKPGERTELARRLQPRIDRVPCRPVTLRIHARDLAGMHKIRLSSDGILHSSSHGGRELRINHLSLPESFGKKDRHFVSNQGLDRLYPDALDFSTFDVIRERKHTFGAMSLVAALDRIEIGMLNSTGSRGVDFDLSLTFHDQGFVLANRFEGLWDVKFYSWKQTMQERAPPEWSEVASGPPLVWEIRDRIDFRSCDKSPFEARFPPPLPKLPHDRFGLSAESTWELPAGSYEFRTLSDDGVRVYVDEVKVIDRWNIHWPKEDKAVLALAAGPHRLRVEYFQNEKYACLQFAVRRLGNSP